jgi:hypothetical protein
VIVDVVAVVDLDVSGDGDVNAENLEARGAPHATTSEMTGADIPPRSFVPWCLGVVLPRKTAGSGRGCIRSRFLRD